VAANVAVPRPQQPQRPGQSPKPWQDPASRPFLRVASVTKRFGETYAVDNVSLDIFRGEFFALLGPSGCGKTTLLRMLAGFEAPTSGRIEIDGQDMSAVPPWRRPVNMMFQSYALFPHMNVERNVAFGLRQDRLPEAEIRERVGRVLDLVQLGPLASRRPDQLSGGQRQRVALARAIVKRPKLLLLDEPLGALDKKLRERTQFELVNIQETLGITFVIVTHDQEEAMTVATRLAIMRDGQVAQLGTPAEIYEYPTSRFSAEFMGDANILEGRVAEAGPRPRPGRVGGRGLRHPRRPGDDRAGRPDGLGGGQAGEAGAREGPAGPPGRRTASPDGGGHRLPRRRLDLPRPPRQRRRAAGHRRQPQRLIERPVTWEDEVWLTWAPDASVVLTS
jgi:putrescine transport system ATP-binding protein